MRSPSATAGAKLAWVLGVTGAVLADVFGDSTGVVPAFGGGLDGSSPLLLFSKLEAVGNCRPDEEEMK